MRVALGQIAPDSDDFAAGLAKHVAFVEQAIAARADLIVFPELSLTGDAVSPYGSDVSLTASAEALQPFLALSGEIDIVVGLKERDEVEPVCHNSAFYYSRGRLAHRHHKLFLLDYGLWDEGRRLAHGEQLRAVDTRLGRLALLICNDVWHPPAPYLAALDGAEMLIVPANSARGTLAGRLDVAATWEQMNRAYAAMMGFYNVFVNRVGVMRYPSLAPLGVSSAEHPFWGGSEIVGPDGRVVVKAPYDDEALVLGEIELAAVAEQRRRAPLIRDTRLGFFREAFARLARERSGPRLPSEHGESE